MVFVVVALSVRSRAFAIDAPRPTSAVVPTVTRFSATEPPMPTDEPLTPPVPGFARVDGDGASARDDDARADDRTRRRVHKGERHRGGDADATGRGRRRRRGLGARHAAAVLERLAVRVATLALHLTIDTARW